MNIRILRQALEISKNNTIPQIESMIKMLKSNDLTPIIIEAVEAQYNVTLTEMQSKSRQRHIVDPRSVAMYLMYRHAGMTQKKIGEYFGGRDHSTVIHAIASVERNCFLDEYRKNVEIVERIVELSKSKESCDISE
jgi:chromosomal replication initiator protein